MLVNGSLWPVSGGLGSCRFGREDVLSSGPLLLVSDKEGGWWLG